MNLLQAGYFFEALEIPPRLGRRETILRCQDVQLRCGSDPELLRQMLKAEEWLTKRRELYEEELLPALDLIRHGLARMFGRDVIADMPAAGWRALDRVERALYPAEEESALARRFQKIEDLQRLVGGCKTEEDWAALLPLLLDALGPGGPLGDSGADDSVRAMLRRALESSSGKTMAEPGSEDYVYFDGVCDRTSETGRRAYEAALEAYAKLREPPKSEASHIHSVGMVLLQYGDYRKSLACFEQLCLFSPGDGLPWNNRAWCCLRLRRYEEALGHCEKALELLGDHSHVHHDHAAILMGLQRYEEALAAVATGITRKPVAPQLVYLWATLLDRKGDTAAAVTKWDEFVEQTRPIRGHEKAVARACDRARKLGVVFPTYQQPIASVERLVLKDAGNKAASVAKPMAHRGKETSLPDPDVLFLEMCAILKQLPFVQNADELCGNWKAAREAGAPAAAILKGVLGELNRLAASPNWLAFSMLKNRLKLLIADITIMEELGRLEIDDALLRWLVANRVQDSAAGRQETFIDPFAVVAAQLGKPAGAGGPERSAGGARSLQQWADETRATLTRGAVELRAQTDAATAEIEVANRLRSKMLQEKDDEQQKRRMADSQFAAFKKVMAVLGEAVKAIEPVRSIGRIDSLWGRIRGRPRRAEEARALVEIALAKLEASERQTIARGSLHNRPLTDAVDLMVGSLSNKIAERVKAYDASTNDCKRRMKEHDVQVKALAAKVAETDKAIRGFQQRITQLAGQQQQLDRSANRVASLVSSLPLRQVVATQGLSCACVLRGNGESRLLFRDAAGVKTQRLPKGSSGDVATPAEFGSDLGEPVSMAPLPGDGARFVVGETSGRVRIWDQARQTPVAETSVSGQPVLVAADEDAVYVGFRNEVRVCDPTTLAIRDTFFMVGAVTCLQVDGPGRKLYAGEKHPRPGYSAVYVWDLAAEGTARRVPRRLRGFDGPVTTLAVSSQATLLAVVDEGTGDGGRVFFWDLNDLRIQHVESCPASPVGGLAILKGHEGGPLIVATGQSSKGGGLQGALWVWNHGEKPSRPRKALRLPEHHWASVLCVDGGPEVLCIGEAGVVAVDVDRLREFVS